MSVLTPVLNEAAVLERTVPTMLAQRLGDGQAEFIFAEGNSRDRSREILERFAAADPRVRVIDNPSGRTPDGLNIALAQARGEYVARMDAHCFYPNTYLADGIARLARGDVAWVAGPSVPRAYGGFSGAIALALSSPLGRGPSQRRTGDRLPEREVELTTSVFLGVWRREAIERHGGWDPRWLRNQDSELAARFLAAGERIVSLPSMAAELLPRDTLRGFVRQYHGFGRYRAQTLVRHPLARRHTHSLALAPALVTAVPLAASARPAMRLQARALLVAYAAAVSLETARAGRRAPLRDVAQLPAAFVAMHFGFGTGMLRGLGEVLLARSSGTQALEGVESTNGTRVVRGARPTNSTRVARGARPTNGTRARAYVRASSAPTINGERRSDGASPNNGARSSNGASPTTAARSERQL